MIGKLSTWMKTAVTQKVTWFAVKKALLAAFGVTVVAAFSGSSLSWSRVAVCMAIVLLLPLVFFLPLRKVTTRKSNLLTALVLVSFFIVDLILGFAAVNGDMSGWMRLLVLATIVCGGFIYVVAMMAFAARLERS